MNSTCFLSIVLGLYGLFLIVCGIASVVFIGWKAKTALVSGGLSGSLALALCTLAMSYPSPVSIGGIGLAGLLFCVFAWRSTKTLFTLLELVHNGVSKREWEEKAIAFLIIGFMAVVSFLVLAVQVVAKLNNGHA